MDTPDDNNKGPINSVSSVNEQVSDEIRPEDERALVLFLVHNIGNVCID